MGKEKSESSKSKLTPLMQQFWEVKDQHPDKVLLFRMGDFFEMFHDDAVIAAPILNIALTQRNKKAEDSTPMCGVPHHSIAGPINKLLNAGHKIAICDQLEDPKQAKGLVKRGVTRILTPGMVFDADTLAGDQHNYLSAFDEESISFVELTTGETFYFPVTNPAEAVDILRLVLPKELVLTEKQTKGFAESFKNLPIHLSEFMAKGSLPERFENTPQSFRRLLFYISDMQSPDAIHGLGDPEERSFTKSLKLTDVVVRHLELFENYRGDKEGSVFQSINRTKTPAGTRRLKHFLRFPLADKAEIDKRHDRVSHWFNDPAGLKQVRSVFGSMGDIERRLGKLSTPNCGPLDLVALADSLEAGLSVSQMSVCKPLTKKQCEFVDAIISDVRGTLNDEPPQQFKNGGVIRKGVHPQLDEYIDLSENSKSLLMEMEQRERDSHEIPSLKIKYNNVFGYFIEVTNTHKDKVPDHYKRKQTLTNAERYVTQELHELEGKILSALNKRVELEQQIFSELKNNIIERQLDLLKVANEWALWDVYSSLAWLALEYNYTRASIVESGFDVKAGRHPVVEQASGVKFVPNDIVIEQGNGLLLTGPNMAGKSTLMRQVALIALLNQMGSYIPAKSANIQIYNKLFTRVGASDFLSEGLSTFMVEMVETADILKQADKNSLVVMDEIGRGTSTYDGMSLAQAIMEHLMDVSQSTVLFATHYHELTRLENKYSNIKNGHMTISESGDQIHFLYTLAEGAANRSYGIQVAKLAGLPGKLTRRAQTLLGQLESFNSPQTSQLSLLDMNIEEPEVESVPDEVRDLMEKIKTTSIQSMTPLEAMNKIAQWQQDLS